MYTNFKFCFTFWGISSPMPLPGFCPWTPLGDMRHPRPPGLAPHHVNPLHYKILGTPMIRISEYFSADFRRTESSKLRDRLARRPIANDNKLWVRCMGLVRQLHMPLLPNGVGLQFGRDESEEVERHRAHARGALRRRMLSA